MGEKESEPFQFTFNGFLKVAFQGSRVTSDAGLILVRELDERLGLEAIIAEHLSDSRHGLNTQFPLPDLLRQSIYSRLAGYEDLNDAARLSTDPTFRLIGSPKRWDRSAALTSTLHWFETELLTREENLVGLMAVNRDADRTGRDVGPIRPRRARHGFQREPGAWAAGRQRLQRALRVGLLSPAVPVQRPRRLPGGEAATGERLQRGRLGGIARARDRPPAGRGPARRVPRRRGLRAAGDLRGAGGTRRPGYAIRIPANKNLELAIEDILFRSPGRPSRKPLVRYKSFQYQADSWTTPRRVVAKVEHHVGELFPRVGFIVTNLPLPNRAVVRFYNKRGTAEQWIKEGKQAAHWTRLSCHRFRANEVRLQLSVLAYNLGNLWRRLVLPARIDSLVADQSPAAPRQDGWAAGQARPVLLAAAGRESSDAAAVRVDAPADLGAPGAGGLAERWATTPERAGSCSSNRCERSGPSSSGAGGHYRRR